MDKNQPCDRRVSVTKRALAACRGSMGIADGAVNADRKSTDSRFTLPGDGYVRQSQLLRVVPFSSATLWRRIQCGRFPRPVKLSERVTAWRVDAVRQWLADPLGFRS